MKRVLLSSAAVAALIVPVQAADIPVKAPPPVVSLHNWTGCYIGVHGGFARGKARVYDGEGFDEFNEIDTWRHDVNGWLVGGQVGCQLQRDRWVFGIEGQAAWADINGGAPYDPNSVVGPGFPGFQSEIDIIGSIALRLAYAFGATGQTLLFVKGGAAFVHEQYAALTPGTPFAPGLPYETTSNLRWGWMVGAGFEQALNANWSMKAEYNFSHFGKKSFDFCFVLPPFDCFEFAVKQNIHVVKVGINYRFGAPVVARY